MQSNSTPEPTEPIEFTPMQANIGDFIIVAVSVSSRHYSLVHILFPLFTNETI